MIRHSTFVLVCALMLAILTGCNLPMAGAPATQPPAAPPADAPAATAIATLPPTATVEPTEAPVVVTAASGSLNIRRGPSSFYNILNVLRTGQIATATARNEEATWLYIGIPDTGNSGWISAGTQFTTITGNINGLPVRAVEPPLPAYIRNCTYHPMLIQPANVILQPQNNAPDNQAAFPPGEYSATDQSVSGSGARSISLNEGKTIDITTDGLNNSYMCP